MMFVRFLLEPYWNPLAYPRLPLTEHVRKSVNQQTKTTYCSTHPRVLQIVQISDGQAHCIDHKNSLCSGHVLKDSGYMFKLYSCKSK